MTLSDYKSHVYLDEPFEPTSADAPAFDASQTVDQLLSELGVSTVHKSYDGKRKLLEQHLVELPASHELTDKFHGLLDALLQLELGQKKLTDALSLPRVKNQAAPIVIWRGDISTLQVDAIVNAANNRMMGCFVPFHKCIDNVIHCAAGPRLRRDCYTIIKLQGALETTGSAKVTRAYNLPSKFVVHTVGPIVRGNLTSANRADLRSSYLSCLELIKELPQIRSIAFCSISTGVFGFPFKAAARIAIDTVNDWFANNPVGLDQVIFNVFKDSEKRIYQELVKEV